MFQIQFNEETFDIFACGNALITDLPNSHAYCVEEIINYTQKEYFVDFSKGVENSEFGQWKTWIKLFRKNLSNSTTILSNY